MLAHLGGHSGSTEAIEEIRNALVRIELTPGTEYSVADNLTWLLGSHVEKKTATGELPEYFT